jgi:hypothetical protein
MGRLTRLEGHHVRWPVESWNAKREVLQSSCLNVAVSKFVEVNEIPRRVLSRNPVDTGNIDVSNPMFGISVYHHSNAV